jgi:hypothetical protein
LKSLNAIESYETFTAFVEKKHDSEVNKGNREDILSQVNVLAKRKAEKEVLDDLKQQICTLRQNIESSKSFLTLLRDISSQSNKNVVIYSRKRILDHFNDIDLGNYKEKIISLNKYGFRDITVSAALAVKFDSERIHKLTSFLKSLLESQPVTISNPSPEPSHGYYENSFAMSQVMNEAPHESFHVVAMMASKKLVVDVKWDLKNTHLVLIAPVIDFVKGATFRFLGENAEPHVQRKAADATSSSEHGKDGLDGNPGFSSGSLSVFALKVVNAHNLKVRSLGGDGADGQDGGNGMDGELGEETVVTTEKVPIVVDAMWAAIPFAGTVAAVKEYIRGSTRTNSKTVNVLKEDPTLGGFGGRAGTGASAGMFQLFIRNEDNANWNMHREKGKNGKPGCQGSSGNNPLLNDRNVGEGRRNKNNVLKIFKSRNSSGHITHPCKYKYDRAPTVRSLIQEYISLAIKDNDATDFVHYISGISWKRMDNPLFD